MQLRKGGCFKNRGTHLDRAKAKELGVKGIIADLSVVSG